LAIGPQQAMASTKSLCRHACFQTLEEQLAQQAHPVLLSQESDESEEGIGAFLEKRQPDSVKLRRPWRRGAIGQKRCLDGRQ
jgi:enoyl-CoA hydratase/carnithine racemase